MFPVKSKFSTIRMWPKIFTVVITDIQYRELISMFIFTNAFSDSSVDKKIKSLAFDLPFSTNMHIPGSMLQYIKIHTLLIETEWRIYLTIIGSDNVWSSGRHQAII